MNKIFKPIAWWTSCDWCDDDAQWEIIQQGEWLGDKCCTAHRNEYFTPEMV